MMEIIKTDKAPAAIGPYSQGVKYDNLVFTSGQIPLEPETGVIVEGGIGAQAHQCLKNLTAVLESAGAGLDTVIKTTIFIKDMSSFAEVNEIYGQYFNGDKLPARSCVEVSELPKGVLVEIEAVAQLKN